METRTSPVIKLTLGQLTAKLTYLWRNGPLVCIEEDGQCVTMQTVNLNYHGHGQSVNEETVSLRARRSVCPVS